MASEQTSGAILRPWTIKAMPEELTRRAVAAARRKQESVADLVTRALMHELDSPTVFGPLVSAQDNRSPVYQEDMAELEQLARLARLLTEEGKTSRALAEARRLVSLRLHALSVKYLSAQNAEPTPVDN